MFREKSRIRAEEMWMMKDWAMKQYPQLTESRVKIMKVGNIPECGEGVEFHFTDSEENLFMPANEFASKFDKIY